MSNLLTNKVRAELFRIIFYQLLVIVGIFLVVFLLKGLKNSVSLLSGSVSYWLPSVIFIGCVSRYTGAKQSMQFIAAFLIGESAKLILSGILFIMLMHYLQFNLLYAFCGLAVGIVAFWLAAFGCLFRRQTA